MEDNNTNKPDCQWCGAENQNCDCEERINCPKAGQKHHHYCGMKPCGVHPMFYTCDCPEEKKNG